MTGNENHIFANLEMADMYLMYRLEHWYIPKARRLYQVQFPECLLPSHIIFS